MINKRNYLNHVTMIDSQSDRSQPMLSTNQPYSNNNFYRSPLRDRQNKMNLSNTPLRSAKQSLSPLRLRKAQNNNQTNNSVRTMKRKQNFDQRNQQLRPCFNHPQKSSKFYVQAPDQVMYCCQKCAILLASQGFAVRKFQTSNGLDQSSFRQQVNNPRKNQIQQFMSQLQGLSNHIKSMSSSLNLKFNSSQNELNQQLSKIEEYYMQFYQILNEHKKRVITEVKQEYQKNNNHAFELQKDLKQALQETQSMRTDILQSWDDIIFVAQQQKYRPVINAYRQKLQSYQLFTNKNNTLPELKVRKLNFINTDSACEALQKGLQVQWEDQQRQYQEEHQQTPVNDDKQSQMGKYSKQSDLPQNPVEYLQKDQKFVKSSLKDLVGLFSSFEQ